MAAAKAKLVRNWIRDPKFASVRNSDVDESEDSTEPAPTATYSSPSRLRKFSRSLGFETIYLFSQKLLGRSSTPEEKKIAIAVDLRLACYVSLLHFIPVTASITLLVLNWRGYYVGGELAGRSGEDGLKFLGLQFASKIIELMALASLSTIMFAILRHQLLSESLPFGAVSTGLEFSKLQLLWSREFASICASKFSSRGKKSFLIVTTIVFTILGATVGPSAATATKPTLRNWEAGGTEFWLNVTSQDLYPAQLDEVLEADLPCGVSQSPFCYDSNHKLIGNQLLNHWPVSSPPAGGDYPYTWLATKALISGRWSTFTLNIFTKPEYNRPNCCDGARGITIATSPLSAISDTLFQIKAYWRLVNTDRFRVGENSFFYYNDVYDAVKTTQPMTFVSCVPSTMGTSPWFLNGDGNYIIEYKGNDLLTLGSEQWFSQLTDNGTRPGLSWVTLPEENFGETSIGALVTIPRSNKSTTALDQILACTIDARWANATAEIAIYRPVVESSWDGNLWKTDSKGKRIWPSIKISSGWAESINAVVGENSKTVFEELCNAVGRLNDIGAATDSYKAVEAILALMFTDGLARRNSMVTIFGFLKGGFKSTEWRDEIMPKKTVYGPPGSAFNYTFHPGDNATRFEAAVTVNGYGYGRIAAPLISTVVLLVYTVIAVGYVVFTVAVTRKTGDSWDSITELVALAMNSEIPREALKNCGVGIERFGTLKGSVRIGVKGERVQLLFEDGEDVEKVRANEKYG